MKVKTRLPISLERCWDFFSDPSNLRVLTPEKLSFEVVGEVPAKIYEGQLITYRIKPVWNIGLEWVTEITHISEYEYFIDEQRFGPYKFWHHEHHFKRLENGVEVEDIIYYKMPYGLIGELLYSIKVKKDLENIFTFRDQKLRELFG